MVNPKCVVGIFSVVFMSVVIEGKNATDKYVVEGTFNPRQIWHEFPSKDQNVNKNVDYTIENIPESRFDEALDLLTTYYMLDHSVAWAFKLYDDAEAQKYFRTTWEHNLKQNLSIGCFRKGSRHLVAISMLTKVEKFGPIENSLPRPEVKSANLKKYFDFMDLLQIDCNPFVRYSSERLLLGSGIAINWQFRNRGIEKELFLATEKVCKHNGIKAALFIAYVDYFNAILKRLDFDYLSYKEYEDIRKKNVEKNFPEFTGREKGKAVWGKEYQLIKTNIPMQN